MCRSFKVIFVESTHYKLTEAKIGAVRRVLQ